MRRLPRTSLICAAAASLLVLAGGPALAAGWVICPDGTGSANGDCSKHTPLAGLTAKPRTPEPCRFAGTDRKPPMCTVSARQAPLCAKSGGTLIPGADGAAAVCQPRGPTSASR